MRPIKQKTYDRYTKIIAMIANEVMNKPCRDLIHLKQVCADAKTSQVIPYQLSKMGYLILKNGNYYWYNPHQKPLHTIIEELVTLQRHSNKINKAKRREKSGQTALPLPQPQHLNIPSLESFIKDLPSEALVKEIIGRGFYVLRP